jgi:hypothetical protein
VGATVELDMLDLWSDKRWPRRVDGNPVLNPDEVRATISTWIDQGVVEAGTCSLCFEDFSKLRLLPACGRRRCHARACTACLDGSYGQLRRGELCRPPNLLCPFCKSFPSSKTLRRHNRDMCTLSGVDVDAMDPTMFYGWCMGCYKIRPAMAKDCSEELPVLSGFKCAECSGPSAAARDVHTNNCPGCGVTTEKTSGCNHIMCPCCGADWCYACGERSTAEGIYTHMIAEHGGYGVLNDDVYENDDGY